MKKGYCDICGEGGVELKIIDEAIYPGSIGKKGGIYSMCEWCFNIGASVPFNTCSEKNQRMGELSRGLRFLYSKLKS